MEEQHIKTCDYCGKQYKLQRAMDKHKIPCKVLFVERAKRLSAKEPIFQSEEDPVFSLKQEQTTISTSLVHYLAIQNSMRGD